jgi:hypothetical protein
MTGSLHPMLAHVLKAPRCGAKNRRGLPCQCPAMKGRRRCSLHGGKSTGARTPLGLQKIRKGSWKHGLRSKRLQDEAKSRARQEERRMAQALMAARADVPTGLFLLAGAELVPTVKVRGVGTATEPPAEWAREGDNE